MLSFHNPHYHPNLKSTWFAYYSLWLLQLIPTINESSFSLSLSLSLVIFSLCHLHGIKLFYELELIWTVYTNFWDFWPELFPPCMFSQLKNCNFSSQWSTNENLFSSKVCKPKCLPQSPGILQGRLFFIKKNPLQLILCN